MFKEKIALITGGRADYGLLKPIIQELSTSLKFELKLFVTGAHLSPEFDLTYTVIKDDGFEITDKIEMLLSTDTDYGVAKSIGLGVISFVEAFKHHSVEKIIVLGDRYEIFAAVQAAAFLKLKIVHIHGGEVTEGVIDDNIRHSITKFSHIHFVANDVYRKRVIQLGEDPKSVFNVGAPGLDNIKKTKLLSKYEVQKELKIQFKKNIFLVTFHPLMLSSKWKIVINEVLSALKEFKNTTIVFTYPNADAGSKEIIKYINIFVKQSKDYFIFNSLGSKKYFSLMKLADVVIGNSSSGIIEAPFLKTPTIDIGDRQKGRLKASSIVVVSEKKVEIIKGIKKVMSKKFQFNLNEIKSYYGNGNAAKKIMKILLKYKPSLIKKFYDLK